MKQVGSYTFIKRIGKGHYAQVYQAVHTQSKKMFAIKCLTRDGISNNQLKNIENEVLVLERSQHPNVIAMEDRMKSKNSYYLILEYCNGGDLSSLVNLQNKLSWQEAREVILQIVEGMNHLHGLGVLHRDLKLANILVHFPRMEGSENKITSDWLKRPSLLTDEPFLVRIADLGFSKIQPAIQHDLNTTYCGTPINMAPEVLNRESYNYKVDIWSIGTILYELICGYSPYRDATNKEQLKKKQKCVVNYPKDLQLSQDCKNFISMCLTYNPQCRPSWEDLLNHRFLREGFMARQSLKSSLIKQRSNLSFQIGSTIMTTTSSTIQTMLSMERNDYNNFENPWIQKHAIPDNSNIKNPETAELVYSPKFNNQCGTFTPLIIKNSPAANSLVTTNNKIQPSIFSRDNNTINTPKSTENYKQEAILENNEQFINPNAIDEEEQQFQDTQIYNAIKGSCIRNRKNPFLNQFPKVNRELNQYNHSNQIKLSTTFSNQEEGKQQQQDHQQQSIQQTVRADYDTVKGGASQSINANDLDDRSQIHQACDWNVDVSSEEIYQNDHNEGNVILKQKSQKKESFSHNLSLFLSQRNIIKAATYSNLFNVSKPNGTPTLEEDKSELIAGQTSKNSQVNKYVQGCKSVKNYSQNNNESLSIEPQLSYNSFQTKIVYHKQDTYSTDNNYHDNFNQKGKSGEMDLQLRNLRQQFQEEDDSEIMIDNDDEDDNSRCARDYESLSCRHNICKFKMSDSPFNFQSQSSGSSMKLQGVMDDVNGSSDYQQFTMPLQNQSTFASQTRNKISSSSLIDCYQVNQALSLYQKEQPRTSLNVCDDSKRADERKKSHFYTKQKKSMFYHQQRSKENSQNSNQEEGKQQQQDLVYGFGSHMQAQRENPLGEYSLQKEPENQNQKLLSSAQGSSQYESIGSQ